jgi:hypothetical protein
VCWGIDRFYLNYREDASCARSILTFENSNSAVTTRMMTAQDHCWWRRQEDHCRKRKQHGFCQKEHSFHYKVSQNEIMRPKTKKSDWLVCSFGSIDRKSSLESHGFVQSLAAVFIFGLHLFAFMPNTCGLSTNTAIGMDHGKWCLVCRWVILRAKAGNPWLKAYSNLILMELRHILCHRILYIKV